MFVNLTCVVLPLFYFSSLYILASFLVNKVEPLKLRFRVHALNVHIVSAIERVYINFAI